MHAGFIPVAAAATFVAVYVLTPAPQTAIPAQEPAPAAVAPPPIAAARVAEAAIPKRIRPQAPRRARPKPVTRRTLRAAPRPPAPSVYFPGCNAVRAAGLAPLLRGQPGYRPEMDGDDDGIACEPHHRR